MCDWDGREGDNGQQPKSFVSVILALAKLCTKHSMFSRVVSYHMYREQYILFGVPRCSTDSSGSVGVRMGADLGGHGGSCILVFKWISCSAMSSSCALCLCFAL